jgi:hypothetical protein
MANQSMTSWFRQLSVRIRAYQVKKNRYALIYAKFYNLRILTRFTQKTHKGALYHHYDWHFHKMIGYMRRLDGTNKAIEGRKAMDPMAPDKVSKFCIAGSATPLYGYFFYLFMDKVMSVALKPILDNALVVNSEKDLDELLKARFAMCVMRDMFFLRIFRIVA